MKHAYLFPGQGSQFPGMGKALYENHEVSRELLDQADEILGFRISEVMFSGSDEDLKQTDVTQPAVFLHSIMAYRTIENPSPDMVAGHSLGEFSALVANGTICFEDGLKLVSIRAKAMQRACEMVPSTMAAVLALSDELVEKIAFEVREETGEVVVAANYNCPGQLVISGSIKGVEVACARMKEAGAKRALVLPVGGAFHSPLMSPAKDELERAIKNTVFNPPACAVYQNVVATAVTDPDAIKNNLIEQLTGPVRWTQTILAMVNDSAGRFTEVGPGKVLQGLASKIYKDAVVAGIS
ncbi:ACP S-malonyltransferase [Segetibacter sp. 3557_3]|uniref:ACP S-malonyltransferase n=1 Tax=Segetibacter sp. 3557_3 TaxID=2547429 RepID=UPI0010586E03|nr:ACP S-malonyltransferase [Segetibacter sp. 3557_3]TDH21235.1 ACP S-malonyltransferase [Segetibacter sp. 3557_3]